MLEAFAHCFQWYVFEIDRRFRTYIKEEIPTELLENQAFHLSQFPGFQSSEGTSKGVAEDVSKITEGEVVAFWVWTSLFRGTAGRVALGDHSPRRISAWLILTIEDNSQVQLRARGAGMGDDPGH